MKIKASGGIRTLEDARAMIEAGADRLGCSASVAIMEEYLQGTKGYETVFVDRMGREVEVLNHVDATAGNDVYLTIDSKLQADAYNILEKFVAGILVDKSSTLKTMIPPMFPART